MRKILLLLVFCLLWTGGAQALSFSDVEGNWAAEAIEYLSREGILNGFPDGTFRPDEAVTRAQMAKLLVEATGLTPLALAEPPFPDVPLTHWACAWIERAKAAGLILGYPDGQFRPDVNVSLFETLVMLVRAKGWELLDLEQSFFDNVQPTDWCWEEVMTALRHHLILVPDPHFVAMPDPTPLLAGEVVATRAQVAMLLSRLLSIETEKITYDLEDEKAVQKAVDEGHQSWRMSAEQTGMSFLLSFFEGKQPEGRFLLEYADSRHAFFYAETEAGNFLVHLEKLVRQDTTGIWTVVEFDRNTPGGI